MSGTYELFEYDPPEQDSVDFELEEMDDFVRIRPTSDTSPHVGDIPLDVITDINSSSKRPVDELDLVDREDPIVVLEESGFETLEINFVLLPWGEEIDKKREYLKQLPKRDASENDFTYIDWKGYLSVESVDIPQTSDFQTAREGVIHAKYLPWPEYYEESEPSSFEFLTGDVEAELEVEGNVVNLVELSANARMGLDSESRLNMILVFEETTNLNLDLNGYVSTGSSEGFGTVFGTNFGA